MPMNVRQPADISHNLVGIKKYEEILRPDFVATEITKTMKVLDADKKNNMRLSGLPLQIEGEYLDDLITPLRKQTFDWYMKEFKKVDNCRTLRYMTHVVESNTLSTEDNLDYLDYQRYNDAI